MPDAKISLTADGADAVGAAVQGVGASLDALGSSADDAAGVITAAQTAAFGLGDAFGSLADENAGILTPAVQETQTTFQQFRGELEHVGDQVKGLGESVTSFIEDPLSAAKSTVTGFVEELGPFGVGLAAIATTAGGVATSLFEMATSAAETGEGILNFARMTGTAVEQVGTLAATATIGGSSLDGMQSMLVQMQRRLDATGPAADKFNAALADLNINADAFRAAAPTDRIEMLSVGLQGAAGSTNLMSDALAIMGRSGAQNLPFLMKNFEDLKAQGEALGYQWSVADVQASERLNEATAALGVQFSTLKTEIGVSLIPAATLAVEAFNSVTASVKDAAGLNILELDWQMLKGAIGEAALANQQWAATQDTVSGLWNLATKQGLSAGDAIYDVATKMLDMGYKEQAVADATGLTTGELKNLEAQLKNSKTAVDAYADVWDRIAAAEANITAGGPPLSASIQGQVLQYQTLGFSVQEIATALQLTTGQVTGIEVAHTKATAAAAAYEGKIDTLTQAMYGEKDALYVLDDWFHRNEASIGTNAAAVQHLVDQIDAYRAKGQEVPADLLTWADANRVVKGTIDALHGPLTELSVPIADNTVHTDEMRAKFDDARGSIQELTGYVDEFHDGITVAGDTIATVTIPEFTTLATGVVPQTTQAIKDATKATASFSEELTGSLDQALTSMPNLLVKAFTGGGGLSGALDALGSKFGADLGKSILGKPGDGGFADTLTDNLGSTLGGVLGAAIPAVGSLIGPAISALMNIGGPSKEELAGRQNEGQFEQQMGGLAGMQKALMDAGLSADEANAKIQALWAAEKSGGAAVQTQIDGINSTIKQHATDVSTGVTDILNAAKGVGANFPEALKPAIDQLEKMPGLTDAEKQSLDALTSSGTPDLQTITAAASKYGMTIDDLGGKAKQLSISTQADQIEGDYKMLMDTGADAGTVLSHMSKSVSDLVDNAMKYGSALPTAMQPIVKAMFDAGELTDSTGKKITDMSGIKFDDTSDPLAKGLSNLTDTINKLIKLLGGDVPDAAKKGADGITDALSKIKVPTIDVHYKVDGGDDSTAHAASGGTVTATGVDYFGQGGTAGFPGGPRGTDIVPAWLTPGETVSTPGQLGALAARIDALHETMARQATANATVVQGLPLMLKHAMRGV